LTKKDYDCWGVAPPLMPPKAGDRVTTDRRDAVHLARLARSGALTGVYGPTVDEAAMRARPRARADALSACQDAQVRRTAFLLRPDIRSTGRAPGGPAHRRWLSAVVCPTPAQPSVFQAYGRAVTAPAERLQRLAQKLHEHVHAWRVPVVVAALRALRGVPCTVAVPMGADSGALTRLDPPRALMQCLGVIPAEYSSGERRHQGSLPTAGHTQARRALGEGAWASRYPAKGRRHLPRRRETQPKMIQAISWTAQGRLCKRYRPRGARGPQAPRVTVAMARARAGFMWAIAPQLPVAVEGSRTDRYCPHHSEGGRRAAEEAPPRFGVPLGSVQRLAQATRA
jgi:transposase